MRHAVLGTVLAGMVVTGCVADDRYREILTQNDMLQKTNEGLMKENDRLKGQNDDLLLLQQKSDAEASMEREKRIATQVHFDRLSADFQKWMKENPGVQVTDDGKIRLADEVFFETGKAEIRKKSEETLRKLASMLKQEASKGRVVRVEGHTDDQPIVVNKDTYPSNWHLSGARALNVLLFLEDSGVPSASLGFAGYGEFRPREKNAPGRKGNKANRRVEISILE